MADNNPNDNSGIGVVLGIVVAVLIVVGAYFFMQSEGMIGTADTTTVNVETPAPATEPSAGSPAVPPSAPPATTD